MPVWRLKSGPGLWRRRRSGGKMTMETNDSGQKLRPLPMIIFSSRWLQLPLYVGLIFAQCVYVFLFLKELYHLVAHAWEFTEQQIMLVVLGLIDVVMISNLLVMVIVGGYETFVSRLGLQGHPDQPEWLSHVNAGILNWHIIYPLAAYLYRSKQYRPGRCSCNRTSGVVADNYPYGFHPFRRWHCLCRPHDPVETLI
jgi:uncharacterized membrane protein YqhA